MNILFQMAKKKEEKMEHSTSVRKLEVLTKREYIKIY